MAADITGILAASLVAVLGFFIIPSQRRKAKRDFHARLENLRTNLLSVLRKEFDKEMGRSITRIQEAIAPYSRFVRAETARADEVISEMKSAKMELEELRTTIEGW